VPKRSLGCPSIGFNHIAGFGYLIVMTTTAVATYFEFEFAEHP